MVRVLVCAKAALSISMALVNGYAKAVHWVRSSS